MKIVDRETFLAMPVGTIFAKYAPVNFEALSIKGDSLPTNDFCYQDLIANFEDTSSSLGWVGQMEAVRLGALKAPAFDFHSEGRDGCFDADQLFAVYEDRDVVALIARLNEALEASRSAPLAPSPSTR